MSDEQEPGTEYRAGFACLVGRPNAGTKYPGGGVNQLPLPSSDLVRMHIILLRQFGQRLLALDGRQRHFGLESRGMRPASAFCHRRS